MNRQTRIWRWLCLAAIVLLVAACASPATEDEEGLKGKRRSGQVLPEVVQAVAGQPVQVAAAGATGFAPQTRLGYTSGDQWEPVIAADPLRTCVCIVSSVSRRAGVRVLSQPHHDPGR